MEASVINLLQNSPEAVSDRYRASFFSSPGLSHNDTTINDYRESEFNRLFQYSMDSFRSPGESAMYREPLYRPGEDLSPRDGGPDYRHTESFTDGSRKAAQHDTPVGEEYDDSGNIRQRRSADDMPDKGVLDSVSEKENSRTTAAARDRTGEGQRINEKKRENISRQGAKNTEQENDSPDRLSDVKKNNETEKKAVLTKGGEKPFLKKGSGESGTAEKREKIGGRNTMHSDHAVPGPVENDGSENGEQLSFAELQESVSPAVSEESARNSAKAVHSATIEISIDDSGREAPSALLSAVSGNGKKKNGEKPAVSDGDNPRKTVVIQDKRRSERIAQSKKAAAEARSDQSQKVQGAEKKQPSPLTRSVRDEVFSGSEKIIRQDDPAAARQQTMKTGGRNNSVFHNRLLQQMKDNGNGQIVRHTGIILKNGGSGEIKLVLKPENLGNVRIQLQLQDNAITGRILVDSQAVRETFEQNLEDLYRSFRESGFESARLDVEVGGGRSGGKSGPGNDNKNGRVPVITGKVRSLEENIPLIGSLKNADTLIDLVV